MSILNTESTRLPKPGTRLQRKLASGQAGGQVKALTAEATAGAAAETGQAGQAGQGKHKDAEEEN